LDNSLLNIATIRKATVLVSQIEVFAHANIFQAQNAAASDVDATWTPDYH
jgi:hypothetical protein